jgi:competence protein ComEC
VRVRPPILFTAAYGAGLATGLLHFSDPLPVIGVSAGAALLVRRRLTVLLAAAAVLGTASASIASLREAESCRLKLPAARFQLIGMLLDEPDRHGGRVRLRPQGAGCQGWVDARWPRQRWFPAGTILRVTGRWIPRDGTGGRVSGTLVVTDADPVSADSPLTARLRSSLTQSSRTLYGARAPMVDALILGRRGGIDPELQDRFAQSGLVHLLSISGFHVGVITAWMFLVCRAAHLARPKALVVAAAASVAYVGFLGWPAPATRAAALAILLALSRIRQRRVDANPLLAATCLCVLLVDPWAVLDLGGWLSVAALWGASTFTRCTDRVLGPRVVWRTLGSSIGATLATAPITAASFGAVAIVGILLNFAAIPLASLAVPGVFASLLIFPLWPDFAAALAGGAGLGLHLLELLATAGAAIPGGHLIRPAELRTAVPWILLLAAGLWASGRWNTLPEILRRWGWTAVATLWIALLGQAFSLSADTGPGLALHFLDVGQGDGAVLRTPAGHWVLIDAGPLTERVDAGRRVVIPFLQQQGVRDLTLAFVSHAHADHLGGVPSVLDRFGTRLVIEPGAPVPDQLYYGFLDEIVAREIPWHAGTRGQRFTLDSVRFTVLHPEPSWTGWGEDVNEDSLVLLIEYGAFQAIFAGDAGFPAEQEMRSRALPVDLLKVGHHGSRGSTGEEWLDSLRPKAGVVSVGRNNYGHPAPETLSRLRRRRVAVWRTDEDGSVSVTTDGRSMTIQSKRRSTTYDVR